MRRYETKAYPVGKTVYCVGVARTTGGARVVMGAEVRSAKSRESEKISKIKNIARARSKYRNITIIFDCFYVLSLSVPRPYDNVNYIMLSISFILLRVQLIRHTLYE